MKLITLFSNKDELVFAPFAAGAANAIASILASRRWLGTDPDKETFFPANKRLITWVQYQICETGDDYNSIGSLRAEDYGSRAFFPLGPNNYPSGCTETLDFHVAQLPTKVLIKQSDKTGDKGNSLGKGLFANEKICSGQIICTIWGSFYYLPIPKYTVDEKALICLTGSEWKNIVLEASAACPGKYINCFSGTNCSLNAKIVQQDTDRRNPNQLIHVEAVVDIDPGIEILVDYGSSYFLAEAPLVVFYYYIIMIIIIIICIIFIIIIMIIIIIIMIIIMIIIIMYIYEK